MARLGRRQPFKPIINVGGRYPSPFPLQRVVQVNCTNADSRRDRSPIPATFGRIPAVQAAVSQRITTVSVVTAMDSRRKRGQFQVTINKNLLAVPAFDPVVLQRAYQPGIVVSEMLRSRISYDVIFKRINLDEPPSIAQYLTAGVRILGSTYQYNFAFNNLQASSAPTANHDGSLGYAPGSVWVDKVGENAYICIRSTSGAAVWKQIDN